MNIIKKAIILCSVLTCVAINGKSINNVFASEKTFNSKASILIDYNSQTVISSKNENERLPIASMTKIALLELCFKNENENKLNLNEKIVVSENASKMGGSQVFLENGGEYLVSDLIKSVVVASANDASVALAEKLYGSEENCVNEMNNRAKELGLQNTLFNNCTGLPTTMHYSSAYDMSVIFSNLIKYDKYFDYSKIWMDKIDHKSNSTEISNTNKLIKFYNGCDGGKTGFTNEAGFCLTATAKRGNMRLISVVIGAENSKERFNEVSTLFNYGFNNYTNKCVVEKGVELTEKCEVISGKKSQIKVCAESDYYVFSKKNSTDKVDIKVDLKPIKAPIKKGEHVGEIIIYLNDVQVEKINLVSLENVKEKTYKDYLFDVINNYS